MTLAGCPFAGPTADFSASPTEGDAPLTVHFSDLSVPGSAAIETRLWDFGDGTESTEENPVHLYPEHGSYRVTLTVTSLFGTETETKNAYITVNAAPVAAFSANPRVGNTPLSVQFSDESDGGPFAVTTWHWTFGDGETSDEKEPLHSYPQPGAYTVALTVTSQGGTDTETRQSYIQVGALPAASFKASPTTGKAPLDVQFTDNTNTGGVSVTSRTWTFGDGASVTIPAPTTTVSHQYTNTGTAALVRAANLTLNTSIGNFQSPSPVNITIHPINFTADATNLPAPLLANFTDLTSVGAVPITSWAWNFKDGGTSSTLANTASHNFTLAGSYDVELTITTGQGNTATSSLVTPVLVRPVVRYFETTPAFGPKPLAISVEDQTVTGNLTGISRRWTWGDGATSTVSGATASHTFTVAGCYSVTMELVTNEGTFSDNSFAIDVTTDESRLLTPGTSENNGQAGIMFDLQALIDLEIDSYSINFSSSGTACTVRQYVSPVSSLGNESNPFIWSLHDEIVVSSGIPAVLDFDNLFMSTGSRLGMYLYNRTMAAGGPSIRYQTGTPNTGLVASDGRLKLFTNAGKSAGSSTDFNGSTFADRWFVGSVKYNYDVVCNSKSGGLERQSQPGALEFGGAKAAAKANVTVEEETISARTSDGGWAAIGYNSISGAASDSPLLIRTDKAMEFLWEQELGGYALDAIQGISALDDGDLLLWGPSSLGGVEGGLLLLRLDPAGNMRREQVVEGCLASDAITVGKGPEAGSVLLLCGRSDGVDREIPVVYCIDAFSNMLWKTELPSAANRVNWGMFVDDAGLPTIYGSLNGEGDDDTVWLQRLDANGQLQDGQS